MTSQPSSATPARWFTAARLIDLVRTQPGITRASAAQELGIGSGAATELLSRMRRIELLDESPAPAHGRGRPSTVLRPHPNGPVVVAADLTTTGWRVATADITGAPNIEASTPDLGRDPQRVLADMAEAIRAIHVREADRVRAVSVSVAGTVRDDRLVQFTRRGWRDVDLSRLTSDLPADVELQVLVGNDATLAGLAEARTGSARGVGTALHLIITTGIGGALIVDGVPATGAHGSAGEYGHVPFGDPSRLCPCGAHGCWDLTLDGRALAEHRGDPPPENAPGYMHTVLDEYRGSSVADTRTGAALAAVAASLGRGVAGLVNIHDPDVVTLGGLAAPLRAGARESFDDAYRAGLMSYRKDSPPAVLDGIYGDDGPLYGAAAFGVDHITTVESLARWGSR